jgi:pimeloyl-ACP methyl ester carboxylesterase
VTGYSVEGGRPVLSASFSLEKPAGNPYQLIALSQSRLTPDPVVVIGHDWGSVVTQLCASRHPHLIKKLVLLDVGAGLGQMRYVEERQWRGRCGSTEEGTARFGKSSTVWA